MTAIYLLPDLFRYIDLHIHPRHLPYFSLLTYPMGVTVRTVLLLPVT